MQDDIKLPPVNPDPPEDNTNPLPPLPSEPVAASSQEAPQEPAEALLPKTEPSKNEPEQLKQPETAKTEHHLIPIIIALLILIFLAVVALMSDNQLSL